MNSPYLRKEFSHTGSAKHSVVWYSAWIWESVYRTYRWDGSIGTRCTEPERYMHQHPPDTSAVTEHSTGLYRCHSTFHTILPPDVISLQLPRHLLLGRTVVGTERLRDTRRVTVHYSLLILRSATYLVHPPPPYFETFFSMRITLCEPCKLEFLVTPRHTPDQVLLISLCWWSVNFTASNGGMTGHWKWDRSERKW